MLSMSPDDNGQKPDELKEFEGRSGETGSEYYYRGTGAHGYGAGSADKLQALADGYFGLNWVFLGNIGLWVLLNLGIAGLGADPNPEPSPAFIGAMFGMFGLYFLIIAGATFPFNRKIAIGKSWNPNMAILASGLTAIAAFVCCGILGYIVMQQIAYSEMKNFGLKSKAFGLRKKVVQARIEELRRQEASQTSQI